ncbi:SulA-like leucine-rich domain-containing protein [Psychromonas sp. PT13]|uniref:SulA-like leucine-rich domain-containing protein n=1 Tax=Psychromonas sp. PT13 TaxID=3439547 RepID=UPI003EB7CA5A
MLTNYMQNNTQHTPASVIIPNNALPSLTISYDIENYYSLLSHITRDVEQRWILFIAPPGKPNVTFLQQAGIHKNRIITLPQNKIGDHSELLKSTLKSGNYSTVVTWLTDCDASLQNELSELALASNSKCFVYCTQ